MQLPLRLSRAGLMQGTRQWRDFCSELLGTPTGTVKVFFLENVKVEQQKNTSM